MPTFRELKIQQITQLTNFTNGLARELFDLVINSDLTKDEKFKQIKYFLLTYGKSEEQADQIIHALF